MPGRPARCSGGTAGNGGHLPADRCFSRPAKEVGIAYLFLLLLGGFSAQRSSLGSSDRPSYSMCCGGAAGFSPASQSGFRWSSRRESGGSWTCSSCRRSSAPRMPGRWHLRRHHRSRRCADCEAGERTAPRPSDPRGLPARSNESAILCRIIRIAVLRRRRPVAPVARCWLGRLWREKARTRFVTRVIAKRDEASPGEVSASAAPRCGSRSTGNRTTRSPHTGCSGAV